MLLGLVFLTSLIPVFHIKNTVGSEWKGIVPEYIEDSSYYYARVNDVVRGNLLVGNPYFMEHKDSISPAFFLSDWFASIPFILKMPFNFGVLFNIIFWSEVFVLTLYFLFRRFGVSEIQSSIFSFLTYLQVFWLFVRPVAMQVIFPGYALFLLSLFIWSNDTRYYIFAQAKPCLNHYLILLLANRIYRKGNTGNFRLDHMLHYYCQF